MLQTGVPTAYLEDEIRNLMKYGLMLEENGFYLSNIIIYTRKLLIVKEHIPERFEKLLDAMKMTCMYDEMSEIIRILCESGWLLPYKSGIHPTTVIYLK